MDEVILRVKNATWLIIQQGLDELPRKISQPVVENLVGQVNEQLLAEQMLKKTKSPMSGGLLALGADGLGAGKLIFPPTSKRQE